MYLKFVNSRQKNPPKFTVLGGEKANIATFNLHRRPFDGRSALIRHESLHASMSFGQELHHRQLIVGPVLLELVSGRKLAAGDLERDFIAAEPDVVVILHAAGQRIPSRAIRDAVLERWSAGGALARNTSRHLSVIARIHKREMSEHIVVGCQRRSRCKRLEN